MNTKQLKSKILDLAIHGKLVPQNPNDEPASKLLEKIREEKQKLIAEKKIKADKNDSYIYVGDDNRHYEKFADGTVKDIEDEIPFEVPGGWEWCRLRSIAFITKLAGFEYSKNIEPNLVEKGVPLFKGKNVQNSEIIYEFEGYIPESVSDELLRSQVNKKCILTPYVGTIGNIGIHNKPGKYHLGSNVGKIELLNTEIASEEFVVHFLKSTDGYKQLTKHMKATAQESISIEALRDVLLPIPPKYEQSQIEQCLTNLFTKIQNLDDDKSDLQTAIKQAKFKILDLAIHGKLVSQDSSDEPASVLLERLRAEKETKIKAGELKRDKNDSYIYKNTTDNCYYEKFQDGSLNEIEVPFEIPDSWSWVRIKDVISYIGDGDWIESKDQSDKGIRLVQTGNIGFGKFRDKEGKYHYISEDTFYKLGCNEIFPGDILVSRLPEPVGRSCVIPTLPQRLITAVDCTIIRLNITMILKEYFVYYTQSSKYLELIKDNCTGTTRLRISRANLERIYIPLPPIIEQQRILNKIDTLFTQLDQIILNLG